MADFSPASVEIAILIAGALIYVFIWFASRSLSRVAQILARVVPLGLVIPFMIYLAGGMRMDLAPEPATAPRVESQAPPAEAEAERRRAAEAQAQQRAAEEARVKAEQ